MAEITSLFDIFRRRGSEPTKTSVRSSPQQRRRFSAPFRIRSSKSTDHGAASSRLSSRRTSIQEWFLSSRTTERKGAVHQFADIEDLGLVDPNPPCEEDPKVYGTSPRDTRGAHLSADNSMGKAHESLAMLDSTHQLSSSSQGGDEGQSPPHVNFLTNGGSSTTISVKSPKKTSESEAGESDEENTTSPPRSPPSGCIMQRSPRYDVLRRFRKDMAAEGMEVQRIPVESLVNITTTSVEPLKRSRKSCTTEVEGGKNKGGPAKEGIEEGTNDEQFKEEEQLVPPLTFSYWPEGNQRWEGDTPEQIVLQPKQLADFHRLVRGLALHSLHFHNNANLMKEDIQDMQ